MLVCPVGLWSLRGAYWQKLYKTKVSKHPHFSGGRSPYRTPIPDLEGPGPGVLSHGPSLSREDYKKVAVNVPTSAWPQGQGIGLEGPAGPWKASCLAIPTSFSHHAKPYNYLLFKTSFESSRATPGNPS